MNINRFPKFKLMFSLGWLALIFLSACTAPDADQVNLTEPVPAAATDNSGLNEALSEIRTPPTASLPTPTAAPYSTPTNDVVTPLPATLAATPTEIEPSPTVSQGTEEEIYRVAFVAANDVLNVRSEPGADSEISGSFSPDAGDISITGPGQLVSGSMWVPVSGQGVQGWVNSRYLTGQISSKVFCNDTAVLHLLEQLETAVATEDGELLAQIVHPQRGLRLRASWWNPEVHLPHVDMIDLFNSTASYDWGIEDGSGLPISGSFSEIMLPLLQDNLLVATTKTCNQIEHGPTAGTVRLPDGYQNVNQYSYYRPATDALGFDWGTWAIGIEFFQSEPMLSYLVFYQYEI